MSYCLNPYCYQPQNPDTARFCLHCGFKLLLGDRYRAQATIGRGGFGRTFLAIDEYKPSRPPCVIKQFFPQHQSVHDPQQARELFHREAVQLEQLGTHPQIPELLAHFEQAEYQYLVQEFIDGQNLRDEVMRQGPFSEAQVKELLNDLLPVLEFVHQQQVIHRDIKPQNIIRRSDRSSESLPNARPQYVLVDFGAAKSIGGLEQTHTGTSIGSPEFTAPEQAIGKATFASDLYSLGVTCIYLLTQTRPADLYDTEEGEWIWRQHLPRSMQGVLAPLIDKLLQAPVKRRYQSAREVLHDLQTIQIPESQRETGDAETHREEPASSLSEPSPIVPSLIEEPITQLPVTRSQLAQTTQLQPPDLTMTANQSSNLLPWHCTQTLVGHRSWVRSVDIHPNGQQVVSGSGDKTIKIWDLATGEVLRSLDAHESWVRAVAISPDGYWLASCSNDKTVKVWNWQTGKLLHTLIGHTDWVRSVAFSPDGQFLVSGSQDTTVCVWRVSTGERLQTLRGHAHWVISVLFASSSAMAIDANWVVSGSRDKTIRVWDWRKQRVLVTLEGHTDAVNGLALAPLGFADRPHDRPSNPVSNQATRILISGSDDGTVRLWNLATGSLQQTLTEHQGAVNAIALSPNQTTIASGSQDKTIKLWDLSTRSVQHTLTGHAGWLWAVTWSRDGTTLASGSWDGTVKIWQQKPV